MATPQIALDGGRLRLNTTIRLRWLGVAGQFATIILVYFGFGFPLPLAACLAAIALSALLNVLLGVAYPRSEWLVGRRAMALLAYDILQLSALLYLTGGLENPFSFLMVVPVAISASTQPLRITAALAVLAIVSASFLASYHLALPWAHRQPPVLPLYYMAGLWAAIVCCIVFIAIYAWRIGEESRRMQQALTATELVLAREQRLSALDGLAAAAAHQLGTPLSTIALVATEFERDVPKESPLREDIELLQTQTARCREILSELSRNGRERDADHIFSQMRLSHLLEEIAAPLRAPGVAIDVRVADGAAAAKQAPEPVIPRSPGLIHSLGNLVENAADFANARVIIDARYDHTSVLLKITDDGPGFQAGVISHLGEPYLTSRPRGPNQETGMGLGFFIAKTLLERSGASLRVSNRPPPETGALIEVSWPRNRLETAE